jgi:hypothetical protein
MLAWLYKKLIGTFGCNHIWGLLNTTKITTCSYDVIRYNMQCKHCGNIKFIDSKGEV